MRIAFFVSAITFPSSVTCTRRPAGLVTMRWSGRCLKPGAEFIRAFYAGRSAAGRAMVTLLVRAKPNKVGLAFPYEVWPVRFRPPPPEPPTGPTRSTQRRRDLVSVRVDEGRWHREPGLARRKGGGRLRHQRRGNRHRRIADRRRQDPCVRLDGRDRH